MKKILNKINFILPLTMMAFVFAGCYQPIFYNVRKEVKLEKATLQGEIQSIIRVGDGTLTNDKVFVSNGKIKCKPFSKPDHGIWEDPEFKWPLTNAISIIDDVKIYNQNVLRIAADSEYLYAFVVTFSKDENQGEVTPSNRYLFSYKLDGSDGKTQEAWKPLEEFNKKINSNKRLNIDDDFNVPVFLFCTNAPKLAHRKAYITISENGKFNTYELNGTQAPGSVLVEKNNLKESIKSCSWFDGQIQFCSGLASTTDETYTDDPTVWYYSTYEKYNKDDILISYLYEKKLGQEAKSIRERIAGVYSIAVLKDTVFYTCTAGSELVDRNSHTTSDYSNLTSTISALYEALACFVEDPSQTKDTAIAYASIIVKGTGTNSALFTHEGLWSYFPARGKWNIE